MNEILCRQLAIDYCCSEEDVLDSCNHFTIHQFLDGRRRFQESEECFLKIAVVNGKVLFSGKASMIDWCESRYKDMGGEWFFEAKNLRILNDRLNENGYQIETVHPFFTAGNEPGGFVGMSIWRLPREPKPRQPATGFLTAELSVKAVTGNYEIRWYEGGEIEQFRGNECFNEAFAFCADAPDVIGVAVLRDENILGIAGASCDSPMMWQIGIDVDKNMRKTGIGKMLVSLLADEIKGRGILPFYGTSMSHVVSQRVAIGAGFVPAWVELATSGIRKLDTLDFLCDLSYNKFVNCTRKY